MDSNADMSQPVILVVDDEAGVRQSLQMVFNKSYRVIEASAADEAIQKVADESPDVVLLDIMMPGTDGLAVLKQIRSVNGDCQVIMLTGLNTARTAFAAQVRLRVLDALFGHAGFFDPDNFTFGTTLRRSARSAIVRATRNTRW